MLRLLSPFSIFIHLSIYVYLRYLSIYSFIFWSIVKIIVKINYCVMNKWIGEINSGIHFWFIFQTETKFFCFLNWNFFTKQKLKNYKIVIFLVSFGKKYSFRKKFKKYRTSTFTDSNIQQYNIFRYCRIPTCIIEGPYKTIQKFRFTFFIYINY